MRHFLMIFALFFTSSQAISAQISFVQFKVQLKLQAQQLDIPRSTIDLAFKDIKLFKRAVSSAKQDAGRSLERYIPYVVSKDIVRQARQLYKTHASLLNNISKKYGVQPRFILAIWGVESGFSTSSAQYDTMSVLLSRAYEHPNNIKYQQQFLSNLKYSDQKNNQLDISRSNSSGALGMMNFSVKRYLNNAQDFDKDGHFDLWQSEADSFASLALFLKQHGWDKDSTWGRQVKLPLNLSQVKLNQTKTLAQWQEIGLRRFDSRDLPNKQIKATLHAPDGLKGRIYLGYQNYDVLLGWRDSPYFVSAVGYLADRISYPPIK